VTLAEQFGDNLRSLRKWRGYSQETLAMIARRHRTEIGLLERGRRLPRLDTVVVLADALSVDPSLLVVGLELRDRGGRRRQEDSATVAR
jgi:transcriptional regulator with XRE-family HTH domain